MSDFLTKNAVAVTGVLVVIIVILAVLLVTQTDMLTGTAAPTPTPTQPPPTATPEAPTETPDQATTEVEEPASEPAPGVFAEVNGTKLFYDVKGTGEPLVLISGGSLDMRMWDEQFQALAAERQVVRYDPRGVGRSDLPAEPFSHYQDLLIVSCSYHHLYY